MARMFWDGPVGSEATTFAEAHRSDSGWYAVGARNGRTRLAGTVTRNEAGFGGRQWEVSGVCVGNDYDNPISVGDNQFPTLKAAVQAIMARAAEYEATRKQAVSLGLRPALPGDVA